MPCVLKYTSVPELTKHPRGYVAYENAFLYVYPLAVAATLHAASSGMRVLEPGHALEFLLPSTYVGVEPVQVTFRVALSLGRAVSEI